MIPGATAWRASSGSAVSRTCTTSAAPLSSSVTPTGQPLTSSRIGPRAESTLGGFGGPPCRVDARRRRRRRELVGGSAPALPAVLPEDDELLQAWHPPEARELNDLW